MIFRPTTVEGAFLVELVPHDDDRGFFARCFCRREFAERGLDPDVEQCNVSYNRVRGTLRGMHSQREPYEEAKLVRCTRGAIHDAIVDLREASPTYLRHFGVELNAENRLALCIPKGVFHGFLTLEHDTEVFYQMSRAYVPGAALGFRWNDPAFAIPWPFTPTVISPRDATYPDYVAP